MLLQILKVLLISRPFEKFSQLRPGAPKLAITCKAWPRPFRRIFLIPRALLVVANGDQVLAELPLPIGGLMVDEPIKTVREKLDVVLAAAHELGSGLHDPFMAMSFLALEVIPSLKLTDQGLIDVERFEKVPLWVD